MVVKYWSFAGLLLTDWCNARCASCYLRCGPDRAEEMTSEQALGYWRELIEASPHGCRIHLSGGEPFGNYSRLIEIARRGLKDNLGPLQKIETNAFWATDQQIVRERLEALDEAGMQKICISTDPYHQQFVPIERVRLLVRLAEQSFGPQRVQVRWRDWLEHGFDTAELEEDRREELFRRYAACGRDRINGRAGERLSTHLQRKSIIELADKCCRQSLLRSRHVHIDAGGRVSPGTCAGIILGVLGEASVAEIWQQLEADHLAREIVGTLVQRGPVGLLDRAKATGYALKDGYAGKCHLCWDIRTHFARKGLYHKELAPLWWYTEESSA